MLSTAPAPQSTGDRRSWFRRWVLDPTVRGLTGLPLAVAAVPMALVGRAAAAGRLQTRLARRYPATTAPAPAPAPAGPEAIGRSGSPEGPGAGRVVAHSALVFVPALVAFAAVAMQVFTIWSGDLYPLRPDTIAALGHPFTADREVLPGAWGGPTLVGARFVHACVALGLQVVCAVLLHGTCLMQNRVTKWLAG